MTTKDAASEYFEKKNITRLFEVISVLFSLDYRVRTHIFPQELCSMLAFHQPVDPKKFLVEELKKRKNKTNSRFFTESGKYPSWGNYKTSHIHHHQHQTELAGYFGTIQKGKETISKEAFLEAAACLQSNGDEIQVESDKIDKDEFVKLLKEKTF